MLISVGWCCVVFRVVLGGIWGGVLRGVLGGVWVVLGGVGWCIGWCSVVYGVVLGGVGWLYMC